MISKELSATLGFAVSEAKKRRNEYVCVEHLLFAILHDPAGRLIIAHCGGNADNLISALEHFFGEQLERIPDDSDYVLQQTVGFQRVIQRAVNHARSAEKKQVEVGDILASIFLEKDSYAEYFLSAEGITRLDVLQYISHGLRSDSGALGTDGRKLGQEDKKEQNDLIESFTTDLVLTASLGKLDPLIGRELEMERALQVLCRRRKNNPVFVGEAGVGKTAMAEGLALSIHEGRVPELLRDMRIYSLDLGGMLAGTKFRGDFEHRLKGVISELKKRENVILFIDEIHTLVGAGATSSGSMDAANILKPFLSSGEVRCIGATTYEEYKNHFEKDRALSRRFEKIEILEPTVDESFKILKGLRQRYEKHHGIRFTDQALRSACELSAKYIHDRFLPDKAIDVIDEAGASVRLKGASRRKKIGSSDIELIVAKMARIPTIRVSLSDRQRLENLENELRQVVFGQDTAIASLVSAIKRSRAGLGHPEKPVGSFLFTGPTGVGKTEVARQLAQIMGVEFMRFDMSEYMEKHAVARLIGAPPGYVGFDQGGLLTDGIRRHPYSILLLDEIEKAHADVFNILLQVMDHATLTDNNGKKADFRNVILIMTSNAGSREIASASIGFREQARDVLSKGEKAVEAHFSPEFRNRLDAIIAFQSLSHEVMERVVNKFLNQLNAQLSARKVCLTVTREVRNWLARKGYDPKFGARPLSRLIQTQISDALSNEILFGRLEKGGYVEVELMNDALKFQYK